MNDDRALHDVAHSVIGVSKLRELDRVDKASLPIFVGTMLLEHTTLKRRALRELPAIDATDADVVDDPTSRPGVLPADPLRPLGYERADTAASLAMLAGNIAFALGTATVIGKIYERVFARRLLTISSKRAQYVAAMVAWDFLYYWDHRWMHEVRLLWGNHVTHHSGRRYNLSTALRQPWSGILTFWVFMPMPLLGIPAKATAKAGQLNLLYQYWIHTEAIDRLPRRVEAVLNTPSHHRVHHGANTEYLDRNYGGILIIWDKLFGTFEPEVRRVRYGLTKNITTNNPLRIAYHEMADIARDVRRARDWRSRLRYVVGRPGWKPAVSGD
jgi:sterol desaturase/sphingolipid hydroxylase (fatty acid hydroxylase superfamily)